MKLNNFQELERLELEQREIPSHIKQGINSQVGFFQFIGNIFDLYIPKMIDLMAGISGSNKNDNKSVKPKNKYPNL